MLGCAEILRQGLDAIRADPQLAALASACIGADAALQAGAQQASAAWIGSVVTALTGLLVVAGAGLTAFTAWRSAQAQIAAEGRRLRDDQLYIAKRTVYIRATEAIFTGMAAFGRLADLSRATEDVLAPFERQRPRLAQVHLVAELAADRQLLMVEQALSDAHRSLAVARAAVLGAAVATDARDAFGRSCRATAEQLLPTVVAAIGAMRAELGFDADQASFHRMVKDVLVAADG